MEYGYAKKVDLPFADALARIKETLAENGFGVLTEINVQETMKKKLGAEMPPYMILGACNPPFALRALQAEKEVGLLLPCNVIVYEDADGVHISALLPKAAMSVVSNPELASIAGEVEQKLKAAVDAV
jgi:uncharacterized protein (DUF302 family)